MPTGALRGYCLGDLLCCLTPRNWPKSSVAAVSKQLRVTAAVLQQRGDDRELDPTVRPGLRQAAHGTAAIPGQCIGHLRQRLLPQRVINGPPIIGVDQVQIPQILTTGDRPSERRGNRPPRWAILGGVFEHAPPTGIDDLAAVRRSAASATLRRSVGTRCGGRTRRKMLTTLFPKPGDRSGDKWGAAPRGEFDPAGPARIAAFLSGSLDIVRRRSSSACRTSRPSTHRRHMSAARQRSGAAGFALPGIGREQDLGALERAGRRAAERSVRCARPHSIPPDSVHSWRPPWVRGRYEPDRQGVSSRCRPRLHREAGPIPRLHLCLHAHPRSAAFPGQPAYRASDGVHLGTRRSDPPTARGGAQYRCAGCAGMFACPTLSQTVKTSVKRY